MPYTLQAASPEEAGAAAGVPKSKKGKSKRKKQAACESARPGRSGVSTDSALQFPDTQLVTDESTTQPMQEGVKPQPAAVDDETQPAGDEFEAEPVTGKPETWSRLNEGNVQPAVGEIET